MGNLRLQSVTGGYKRSRGHLRLQSVTGGYKRSRGVTRDYSRL